MTQLLTSKGTSFCSLMNNIRNLLWDKNLHTSTSVLFRHQLKKKVVSVDLHNDIIQYLLGTWTPRIRTCKAARLGGVHVYNSPFKVMMRRWTWLRYAMHPLSPIPKSVSSLVANISWAFRHRPCLCILRLPTPIPGRSDVLDAHASVLWESDRNLLRKSVQQTVRWWNHSES